MDIISLLVTLVVFGAVLYAVETLIPMDDRVKRVIQVIASIALLFYVLSALGMHV